MLRVLDPGPQTGAGSPEVDIVAIHGLGGDALKTWRHIPSGKIWLQDFLPQDFPGSRVMSFGYDASLLFSQSLATIDDHVQSLLLDLSDHRVTPEQQQRPIIFIAHSLGGIVAKKLLLEAQINPAYNHIRSETIGLMFFGTPHSGSGVARYGKILEGVVTTLLGRRPQQNLQILTTNSEALSQLAGQFRHQLSRYEIVSFYETKVMGPMNTLIVPKHSALLNLGNETHVPMDANHIEMCKFGSRDDPNYKKVLMRLRAILKKNSRVQERGQGASPRDRNARQTQHYNAHYLVDQLPSSLFTGRQDKLHLLEHSLLPSSGNQEHRVVVIHGLGGSGKTELGLQFAERHRERFWGIFWVDMSTTQSAERGFRSIAENLKVEKLEQSVAEVKIELSRSLENWLLILDNADDSSSDQSMYLPRGRRGKVLITTKNKPLWSNVADKTYCLEGMDPKDAASLLLKTYRAVSPGNADMPGHRKAAQQVVNLLGCLPLAIRHTGALLRRRGLTMPEYCQLFETLHHDLLSCRSGARAGEDAILKTYEISLQMIQKAEGAAATCAVRLLEIFSFFHRDNISEDIFHSAFEKCDTGSNLHNLDLYQGYQQGNRHSGNIGEAIRLLEDYSLIKLSARGKFISIHPVVHVWSRHRMSSLDKRTAWKHAHLILSECIPRESYNLDSCEHLVLHIDDCLRHFQQMHHSQRHEEMHPEEAERFALVYRENGMDQEARTIIERVIKVRKRERPMGQPQTLKLLNSRHNLAIILYDMGDSAAADMIERVTADRVDLLGKDHPDTIASKLKLARALDTHDDDASIRRALKLTEQVLEVRRSELGDEHPLTVEAIQQLTWRYESTGQSQAALELREWILTFNKNKWGLQHPKTLSALSDLSIIYCNIGRRERAIEIGEKVVTMTKKTLDKNHPLQLDALRLLAFAYAVTGQEQKALPLWREYVEGCHRKWGITHSTTLVGMNHLATSYWMIGHEEKNESHQNKAVKLLEEVVDRGIETGLIDVIMNAKVFLGEAYYRLNQRKRGLEVLQEVVDFGTRLNETQLRRFRVIFADSLFHDPLLAAASALKRYTRNPSNPERARPDGVSREDIEHGTDQGNESPRMPSCCYSLFPCKAFSRNQADVGPRRDSQDRADRGRTGARRRRPRTSGSQRV